MREFILALVVSLVAITAAHANELSQREGWVIVPTDYAYSELVSRVNAAVKAEKMGLVTRASASSGAKGRGLSIRGNMIIGVYRNDYAVRMLNASVAAGIEAPIRFYVTENPDGAATLSWKTPVSFSRLTWMRAEMNCQTWQGNWMACFKQLLTKLWLPSNTPIKCKFCGGKLASGDLWNCEITHTFKSSATTERRYAHV